jgi:hypothetical protein
MATFKYNGEDDRVFPSIAVTVKAGDTFDAPEHFVATNVIPVSKKTPTTATTVGE